MAEILLHCQYNPIPHFLVVNYKKYYLSSNVYYSGIHWAVRKKITDTVKLLLLPQVNRVKPFTLFPIHIEVAYHSSKITFDLDNKGYFWQKSFIDLIKERGIIKDDSVQYITSVTTRYVKLRKGEEDILEITITQEP